MNALNTLKDYGNVDRNQVIKSREAVTKIEALKKEVSGVRTVKAANNQEFTFVSVYDEDMEDQRLAREEELKAERDPLIFEIRSLLRSSLSGK